jgi:hypothetical protein
LHDLRIVLSHGVNVVDHQTCLGANCKDFYVLYVFRNVRSKVHLKLIALIDHLEHLSQLMIYAREAACAGERLFLQVKCHQVLDDVGSCFQVVSVDCHLECVILHLNNDYERVVRTHIHESQCKAA